MTAPTSVISTVEMSSGELVGLSAIEVLSVPHVSILQRQYSAVLNMDAEYKADMERMLAEVFQQYKTNYNESGELRDIALELLWCTEEARNQPYRADIKLFLIVRTIGVSETEIESTLSAILQICKSTLELGKYEYRSVPYQDLALRIGKVENQSVCAIVKEERVENLQNQILPSCFSFDRLPRNENDLSRLVNTLTDHPNCAVSFQLIPTSYSPTEVDFIEKMTQALDTLNRGVMEQGVGNIGFALAEKHAAVYKYYSEKKNASLFSFNILVFGTIGAVSSVSTRTLGQLNIGNELRLVSLTPEETQKDDNFYPLPWAVSELLLSRERISYVRGAGEGPNACYRLPNIITAEEASELFRLPIGNENVAAGLVVNESSRISRSYSGDIIGGGDLAIGTLRASSQNDTIGIFLKDLTKHMLIVGTPGSGKTTFSVSLLNRLWKDHGIPFLVIEPAKNEYRALVQSIPDLQVFTPGKDSISPFVLNPFVPPKNVRLEAYKSTLKTAFAAAVTMSSPLDRIFEETVNNCYSNFRWLDTYTSDGKGRTFNISDFIKCFQDTFDNIGYTGDAQNIGRAGVVRLRSLVNLFDNYHSIPIEDILTKPTVIELAAIDNSDKKALIIALLLLSIQAYVNSNFVGDGDLRNVILLEEAHVLLDADAGVVSEGAANPSAIAQGLLKRMLAEIRSYGVGIVIADQSPRKVTPDVVALTDIKLAFRLVEAGDKQIIADSTNMTETHIQRLARLKPGEAFLFFGKMDDPEEIRTPDYRVENKIRITLSDDEIESLSTYWGTRKDNLRPYPECCHVPYCSITCSFACRVLAREVARRIFVKHFKPDSANGRIVVDVLGRISSLVSDELNDEPFTRELLSCVKTHLFRNIRYGTKIDIPDITVRNSLEKA